MYQFDLRAERRSLSSKKQNLSEDEMTPGGRRLKQWLIEQINSNIYSGLQWEDENRTMFRIPWKHAGKQDYNQEVDASIFKAWAVFKGKFKEGDKAEPATWKTRLRCALNKSPDFEEVTDRSQLDISEPYKVYRIVPEEEQKNGVSLDETAELLLSSVGKVNTNLNMNCPSIGAEMECSPSNLEQLIKESSNDEYGAIVKRSHSPMDEDDAQPTQEWWPQGPHSALPMLPDPSPINTFNAAFSQMMVCFYYGGKLMSSTLTTHPEGCRISPNQPPVTNPLLYGPDSLQNVHFPPLELIEHDRQRHVTRKLFGHLERGVLLRANREGIFIKRLCQSRVFWSGQDSQYSPGHSKLERDAVVKIFDTGRFFHALQMYQDHQYPAPDPTVSLCFGEEFNDFSTAKNKLIIVQITAVNCQQLLEAVTARKTQYSSGNLEISDEMASDQMARIYQDLCNYPPQRAPCFRDNLPITA